MKVKELIDILYRCDPEADVVNEYDEYIMVVQEHVIRSSEEDGKVLLYT